MIICTDERKVQRYCTVLGYVAYVNTVRLSHRLNYNFDYHTAIHTLLMRTLTRVTVYLIICPFLSVSPFHQISDWWLRSASAIE